METYLMKIKKLLSVSLLGLAFHSHAWALDQNHGIWDSILKKNVVSSQGGAVTRINYAKIKQNPSELESYLRELSAVSKSEFTKWSQDQQLSFLINAYNAFTVKLVVDAYPVKSIKDIGGLLSSPWKKKFFELLGESFSLDNIEHDTIRKNYNEPRIHFAVNCASIGCPPLRAEAYVAQKLSGQLQEQATLFFGNIQENRFVAGESTLQLSSLLKWYKGDFSKSGDEGLVTYVGAYLPSLRDALKTTNPDQIKVKFNDYDWNLNETK